MSKVISQLKQLQADSHALYIKLHNYHWNVKGMDFNPVHEHTESIYNSMSTLYDDTAERVIQLGGTPYLTMSELLKATKIKEESGDSFTSKKIVKNIVADFEYLLKSFSALSDTADKAGDKTTAAFADDNVASYEKELWILGAMLK
jgi:starvation-inducible DNA-binding protein